MLVRPRPSFQQQRRCVMRLRFEPDHVCRRLIHGFGGVRMLPLKQKLHFALRSLGKRYGHRVTWIQLMERMTVLRKMRWRGRKLLFHLLLPWNVKLALRWVCRSERMVLVLMMVQIVGFVRVPPDPSSRLDLCLYSCVCLCLAQLCFLLTQKLLRVVESRRSLLRRGRQDRQWRGPKRTR